MWLLPYFSKYTALNFYRKLSLLSIRVLASYDISFILMQGKLRFTASFEIRQILECRSFHWFQGLKRLVVFCQHS